MWHKGAIAPIAAAALSRAISNEYDELRRYAGRALVLTPGGKEHKVKEVKAQLVKALLGIAVCLLILAVIVAVLVALKRLQDKDQDVEAADQVTRALVFDGDSAALKRTRVVPTLDTPIPEGESVVWCASFQLAWNRFKSDVAKGPVQVQGAEDVAGRLNSAALSDKDLPANTYYAAAGTAKDGVVDRIRRDMSRRFPSVDLTELDDPAGAILFAHLRCQLKFTFEYPSVDGLFAFTDAAGATTDVRAFGIRYSDEAAGKETYRTQVAVLFKDEQAGEFALDLCKTDPTFELIVARMARQPTLALSLATLEQKRTAAQANPPYFAIDDRLLVPEFHFRIRHRFAELESKLLQNPRSQGLEIGKAFQTTEFHLDRFGAGVDSSAGGTVLNGPTDYFLNRPFLIVMKARKGKQPFFVMWIDNAELLMPSAK